MGKLWENYFLQLTKKFLRGKKGNYFWKKPNILLAYIFK